MSCLAAHAVGAVPIPTYVQLRADDLAYRLADSGARFAVASAALLDEMEAAVAATPGVTLAVADGDGGGRFASLSTLLPDTAPAPRYHDSHAEELTLILYTSGSTGRPKGTCHCHRDLIAAADSYWKHCIGPTEHDVIGGPPSVPFALGYGLTVVFPARFGCAAVLEPDKSVEASLAAIERHGVTVFTAVVSYYRPMAAALDLGRIGSLRRTMTGGEPLLPETETLWREASGLILEQFIGTTEMFHCFLTASEPGRPARSGTMGRAAPGYEVAVLDADTLAPVADGERGLMAVRGCTGTVYWQNEERQRELVRNGWNVFPDVVARDAEGYFRYVGRHDDMIVSAGYNISRSRSRRRCCGTRRCSNAPACPRQTRPACGARSSRPMSSPPPATRRAGTSRPRSRPTSRPRHRHTCIRAPSTSWAPCRRPSTARF